MLPNFVRTAVVTTLLAAAVLPAKGQAPTDMPPSQGMVILRNGEVIEGKISRDEGIYIVNLPNGRIRIKQANVELVCKSLEEGYRRKRAIIQVGNVHDHLDLAEWCLRHNLLGPATIELADATVADPKNPMIAALRHRLKMAMEPPPPAELHSKTLFTPGPSNDDLDRMVRGMPRGSVETFTQSVQPLLLNNCATSGCHGPQSENGLRLWHIAAGRPSSRRTTQRNLCSALQFIDRENPSASRLLTAATKPHGTLQHPIFSEHHTLQYQRLLDWANQIARPEPPDQPESVAQWSARDERVARRSRTGTVAAGSDTRAAPAVHSAATAFSRCCNSRQGRQRGHARLVRPARRSVRSRRFQSPLRAEETSVAFSHPHIT